MTGKPARPRALVPALVLVVCAGVTGAAAAAVVLADEWSSTSREPADFKRILVIGISHDAPARRKFEDRFVSLLRGQKVEGVTSYSLVPDLDKIPDPAKVAETLMAQKVDAVITVVLLPLDKDAEKTWVAGWRERAATATTARAYVEESLRAAGGTASRYGVEFGLWSVGTHHHLWAARTDSQGIYALRDQASDLVSIVINDLGYAGLLH